MGIPARDAERSQFTKEEYNHVEVVCQISRFFDKIEESTVQILGVGDGVEAVLQDHGFYVFYKPKIFDTVDLNPAARMGHFRNCISGALASLDQRA